MKTAYIRRNSANTLYVHITDSAAPKGVICLGPKDGDGKWITDITLIDVDEVAKKATLNQTKYDAKVAAKAAETAVLVQRDLDKVALTVKLKDAQVNFNTLDTQQKDNLLKDLLVKALS